MWPGVDAIRAVLRHACDEAGFKRAAEELRAAAGKAAFAFGNVWGAGSQTMRPLVKQLQRQQRGNSGLRHAWDEAGFKRAAEALPAAAGKAAFAFGNVWGLRHAWDEAGFKRAAEKLRAAAAPAAAKFAKLLAACRQGREVPTQQQQQQQQWGHLAGVV
uniref:Uncharacterized protein n=1 Tax=Tetradesmus obliquus TaxID=3088 RepID=A0A383V1L2_TETOB